MKKVLACLFSIILLTGSILPVYAESIATLPSSSLAEETDGDEKPVSTEETVEEEAGTEEANAEDTSTDEIGGEESGEDETNEAEIGEEAGEEETGEETAAEDIPIGFSQRAGGQNLLLNGGFEVSSANPNNAPYAASWSFWDAAKVAQWTGKLDTTASHEGGKSLYFSSASEAVRVSVSQKVSVDADKSYLVSAWIKTDSILSDSDSKGILFRVQYQNDAGQNVGIDGEIPNSPVLKGTNEWTQCHIYLPVLPDAATKLSVEFFLHYAKGEVWFDEVEVVETFGMQLQNVPASLVEGNAAALNCHVTNLNGNPPPDIVWSSSDPDIAQVDQTGLVTAKAPGRVTISARAQNGVQSVSAVLEIERDFSKSKPSFQNMREDWRNRLTGNDFSDKADPIFRNTMQEFADNAQQVLDDMIQTASPATLWPDLNLTVTYPGKGNSNAALTADFDTAYDRILTMALAYASEECPLYHDAQLRTAVLDGLDWMHEHVYHENYDVKNKTYGNWWHWSIGMPQKLADIAVLMYEDLTLQQIESIYLTLDNFNKDPNYVWNVWGTQNQMTSANLMDTTLVSVLKNAIGEKGTGVEYAESSLKTILPYVTSGDGFYEDGSCVQHTNLAYTGGYGVTLLRGIEKLLFVLDRTEWKIDDPEISNVYEWIWNGYRPLIAFGGMMDMVSGRSIARPSTNDMTIGRGVIQPMVRIAETAPEPMRGNILSFVKKTLQDGIRHYGSEADYFSGMSVADMLALKALLANPDSIPAEEESYHKVFGSMDKVVAHTPAFSLGISMYSSRIASFEYGNGENLKGWHMSDGATYLYAGDQSQYGDAYWPTVDPMRLSGTTTDHTQGTISQAWTAHTSDKNWVGGSQAADLYGSTGMDFTMENSSLAAKKSWFTFGDEVVALGAGITADDHKAVETIVENRKISADQSNRLVVDGILYTQLQADSAANAAWAWLSGNTASGLDSTGYYFPDNPTLAILRESRTGSWQEINSNASGAPITREYASLAIPHGTNPADETYSYVLLPGKTEAETQAYANDPQVRILANDSTVQAAAHSALGVTGMNFWAPAALENIEAKTPLSVTMLEQDGTMRIGVSDPTQTAGSVSFTLAGDWQLVSADDEITVQPAANGIEITADTTAGSGKSFALTLARLGGENNVLTVAAPANAVIAEHTIDAAVNYDVAEQPVDVTVSDHAVWALFSDAACTDEITSKSLPLADGANVAYIQVTAQNGSRKLYTLTITRSSAPVLVSGITISGPNSITSRGGTAQLSAQIFPGNAANPAVTWSVASGTQFASVDQTGLVTALAEGTVAIRAGANDGSQVFDEFTLTVRFDNNAGNSEDENSSSDGGNTGGENSNSGNQNTSSNNPSDGSEDSHTAENSSENDKTPAGKPPEKNGNPPNEATPKTGDSTNIVPLVLIVLGAAAAIVILLFVMRRQQKNQAKRFRK